MACCQCCCAQYDGVCCGTGEEKVCCKTPRECCTVYTLGVGESDVCCTETQYCCNDGQGVCCEVGQICCVGDLGAVCCESNVVCCAGVCCAEGECCADDVCVPCDCESDEDCPEGECCNDGVCGDCCETLPCEENPDCEVCQGIIGPTCSACDLNIAEQQCDGLQEVCAQLGGTFSQDQVEWNGETIPFCMCLDVCLGYDYTEEACSALGNNYMDFGGAFFSLLANGCQPDGCCPPPCGDDPP